MNDLTSLFSAAVLDNPYPLYAELRQSAPVCKVDALGIWLLSRYDDVQYALKSPELFCSTRFGDRSRLMQSERLGQAMDFFPESSLIAVDPPVHTRLRKLINTAFTPKAIARLEPRIRALAHELVDNILRKPEFDLMEELAVPLPVIVISELLGVDPARRADFKRWSDDLLVGSRFAPALAESEVDRLIQSRHEFIDCLRQMIDLRHREPREDLLSDLVRAEQEHEMLTPTEVLSMAILLMVAGNETTTNLIGNGMTEILNHPAQLRRLRADPALIPGFVEEVLRYRSPVIMLTRKTTQDVTIRGVTIPHNEIVMVLIDSANRDPEHFADPDRFDITRQPQNHLSFGYGIHFCVGAPLSRLEGRLVFEELFQRLPAVSRKEGPARWNRSFNLRGLTALPLRFDRAPAPGVVSAAR